MDARLIAAAVPVFLTLILLERFFLRNRVDAVYRFHDTFADLACGIGQQVTQLGLHLVALALYTWVWSRAALFTVPMRAWWAWAVLFVLVDVAFYVFHRASHRVSFFWAAHAVHHQSEEYNLSVALRQSWLEPLFEIAFNLPLAVLGFPPLMFFLVRTVNSLYQFFVHTRGVGRLGPIEGVLNTPSSHRVHHGKNPAYIDKNYAGVFIVLDRWLGTYASEHEEPAYGTVKPLRSFDAWWANLAGWVEIVRVARGASRLRDKLYAFIAPPEWRPASQGGPVTIPAISRATQERFDVRVSRGVDVYLAVSLVALLAVTTWLIASSASVSWMWQVGVSAWVLAGLTTLAGIIQGKRWARLAEGLRVAAGVGLVVAAVVAAA